MKPIGGPPVVRVTHPVLPHTPPHKLVTGAPLTPAQPVHKTGPVMLNGELVSALPKKPVTRTSVGEGDVETVLGNRRVVERPDYPAGQGTRYMGGSGGRENPPVGVNPVGPPARMNPPVVARPLPPVTVRSMPAPPPVQVHSAPPPPPPAPVHIVPAH